MQDKIDLKMQYILDAEQSRQDLEEVELEQELEREINIKGVLNV